MIRILAALLVQFVICIPACKNNPPRAEQPEKENSNTNFAAHARKKSMPIRSVRPIKDTAFIGTDHAWITTGEGALLGTEDGGENWKRLGNLSEPFKLVCFKDTDQGWAVSAEEKLWRTTDSGATWIQASIENLSGETLVGPVQQLTFSDLNHGWLVEPFAVWRTSDGGKNWLSVPVVKSMTTVHECFFINSEDGWLIGTNGALFNTRDGGQAWKGQALQITDEDLRDIFFINEQVGWLCTSKEGSFFYTKDGGETWHRQPMPNQSLGIDSIYFYSEYEGWAVGAESIPSEEGEFRAVVLHSADQGGSWNLNYVTEKEVAFEKVHFSDTLTGWLVATSGRIYRTNDGGRSWRIVLENPNSI